MAVDENGNAEVRARALQQTLQGSVVGLVEPFDAPGRLIDGQAPRIDLLRLADHACDRSQAAGDANRARVRKGRQTAVEHAWVEFVGLTIDVEIGARKSRPEQWRAEAQNTGEQFVDVGVFGPAQRQRIELGGAEKTRRIDIA